MTDAPQGQGAGVRKLARDDESGKAVAQALRRLQMHGAAGCGRQVAEVEERRRQAGEQRCFGNDSDLGSLKQEGVHVEHVAGQVDGVVVDPERRQVGEVVGRHRVVLRRVERVVEPVAGGVTVDGHGE